MGGRKEGRKKKGGKSIAHRLGRHHYNHFPPSVSADFRESSPGEMYKVVIIFLLSLFDRPFSLERRPYFLLSLPLPVALP